MILAIGLDWVGLDWEWTHRVRICESSKLRFQVLESELTCNSYERSKGIFALTQTQSHKPSWACFSCLEPQCDLLYLEHKVQSHRDMWFFWVSLYIMTSLAIYHPRYKCLLKGQETTMCLGEPIHSHKCKNCNKLAYSLELIDCCTLEMASKTLSYSNEMWLEWIGLQPIL